MDGTGRRWRTAAVAIGAGIGLLFATPGFASVDNDLARLVELNPGVSAAELEEAARDWASANGVTYADALARARSEAEAALGESSTGGDCSKRAIGEARNKGDVFHSTSSLAGVEHGHTGLYRATNYITEAPGPNKKSDTFEAAGRRYCATISKMSVDTSGGNRSEAADYADASLTGKSYDLKFAFNKDDSVDWLNCSELVWKAYKRSVDVDLDGDGGTTVFPADIRDSSLTDTYETLR
ncbi:hypothetical protein [Glycomyces sp. NPDC048151]|uniref:hypothetical protein n=1 Tax=Glycomyces sp. NPDC048151 TaxID=3364002 RepID=UPI0037237561